MEMKIHNKGKCGSTPACHYAQFASREEAINFRNEQYKTDMVAWKAARASARLSRLAGKPCTRPSKIARPLPLAIHWHSLTLVYVKKHGDWQREFINKSGRLI